VMTLSMAIVFSGFLFASCCALSATVSNQGFNYGIASGYFCLFIGIVLDKLPT